MLKQIIKKIPFSHKVYSLYRKTKSGLTLSDKGERVDITYTGKNDFDGFDMFQKSHYRRYEYAKQFLNKTDIVGDFACGTGYGTSMLSENATEKVIGIDINERVINKIKKRYEDNKKVEFLTLNILDLPYKNYFDEIVSFETIEHLEEQDIMHVFKRFFEALKPHAKMIFSTPYMQEKNEKTISKGFHKTFFIDEEKIIGWLKQTGFDLVSFRYQNYESHTVLENPEKKDFIVCIATKIK
jgi:2-polyprenyl-3-methyl-5-hydroxy-6-metoxy-1,4-benzoquinol methylase